MRDGTYLDLVCIGCRQYGEDVEMSSGGDPEVACEKCWVTKERKLNAEVDLGLPKADTEAP